MSGRPDATTTVARADIAFSANEPGVTFLCSVDGGEAATCSSPVLLEAVAPGEHRFQVLGTDPAGNSSAWVVVSWRYREPDTRAPVVRFTASPAASTTSTAASFSFVADEAGVAFTCALDGAAFAACTSPAGFVRLAAGQHGFVVRATDAAGNTGQATFSWTITQPLPDLAITAFTANSITITNRGTATSAANVLTITLVSTFTVPSLRPGASVTLTWSICRNGTYSAIVDRTNVVAESDEKNNTASRFNQCPIG